MAAKDLPSDGFYFYKKWVTVPRRNSINRLLS